MHRFLLAMTTNWGMIRITAELWTSTNTWPKKLTESKSSKENQFLQLELKILYKLLRFLSWSPGAAVLYQKKWKNRRKQKELPKWHKKRQKPMLSNHTLTMVETRDRTKKTSHRLPNRTSCIVLLSNQSGFSMKSRKKELHTSPFSCALRSCCGKNKPNSQGYSSNSKETTFWDKRSALSNPISSNHTKNPNAMTLKKQKRCPSLKFWWTSKSSQSVLTRNRPKTNSSARLHSQCNLMNPQSICFPCRQHSQCVNTRTRSSTCCWTSSTDIYYLWYAVSMIIEQWTPIRYPWLAGLLGFERRPVAELSINDEILHDEEEDVAKTDFFYQGLARFSQLVDVQMTVVCIELKALQQRIAVQSLD